MRRTSKREGIDQDSRVAGTDDATAQLVDALCSDVRALLARWKHRYRTDPDALSRKIWLMALEREQIASVAYRGDDVLGRVAELDISDDLASVLRQTLAWIWKDEEMHVEYARARLATSRRPVPSAVILGHQLFGAVSGWVSVASNHADRRREPLRTAFARAIVLSGRLTRQIPPELATELRQRLTFRRYCLLNVALEESALLGYDLLIEHLGGGLDERRLAELRRIADDERRHAQCFAILAAAFGSDDRLLPGVSTENVICDIGTVSRAHLPARIRVAPDDAARTIAGADTRVARSAPRGTGAELDDVLWPTLGSLAVSVPAAGDVVIKAAFMLGYHREDTSTITSPEVVESIARWARANGAASVTVVEATTIYDHFYAGRSVREVANYFGFRSPHYEIADAADDQVEATFDRGLSQHTISKRWRDADLRIVVSKLRGDPTEVAHIGLDTMQGMGHRTDAVLHLDREIDFRTAVMMTLDLAPPDLSIVDGWGLCADGPLGVMGCNRPVVVDRFWASQSVIAADAAVVADLGENPESVIILRRAQDWFGVNLRPDVNQADQADQVEPVLSAYRRPRHSLLGRFICATAYPMYIFVSNRGRWFVPAMDTEAFPEIGRTGVGVRAVRRCAQITFGLRPPPSGQPRTALRRAASALRR